MSMLVSLCLLKIEIDLNDMSDEDNRDNINREGAANVPANSRLIREHRGQRKPKSIRVDNYSCSEMEQSTENRGILPSSSSSRETTPMVMEDSQANTNPDYVVDKTFFSGNPFVEVTKGIIHMYKKK